MLKTYFTWNPQGLRRLSFRDFQWLPYSADKQLKAAVIATLLVLAASGFAAYITEYIAIPNLNIMLFIVIAFLMADRIHPHPLVGPVLITLPIVGAVWLLLYIPDTVAIGPSFVLQIAANLFFSLFTGSLLAVVFKTPNRQPQKK
ncbi:MAG TPA: hypothetical protein GXZ82_08600 [Firmicutes bacterium]|jgi:hypothetical protein|nr:hypothetical protein [Bacillota bacterium]